ncbi:MAG: hypothetical protein WKF84_04085 [Pyrinomonadaceae bacterium]
MLSGGTTAAVILLLLVFYLLHREIAGHRKTGAALSQNEKRYRDLVDNSQAFICTHALDGTRFFRLTPRPQKRLAINHQSSSATASPSSYQLPTGNASPSI